METNDLCVFHDYISFVVCRDNIFKTVEVVHRVTILILSFVIKMQSKIVYIYAYYKRHMTQS